MLSPLMGLDTVQAIGILARAALALSPGFVASDAPPISPNEYDLRSQIYDLAAIENKLASVADDPEKVSDWLSDQLDAISPPIDVDSTLSRLAEFGELASDEYDVEFTQNFYQAPDYHPGDETAAAFVIKNPDGVSDYGLDQRGSSTLQMLLGRWIGAPSERSFHLMLIVCAKEVHKLKVFNSWRVLPSKVNLYGCKNILDIFKSFCNHYGFNVRAGEKTGKFIEFVKLHDVARINSAGNIFNGVHFDVPRGKNSVSTALVRPTKSGAEWSFIAAIDIDRYLKDLRIKGVLSG